MVPPLFNSTRDPMTYRIPIKRGWRLDKRGKLVPCHKHLPVNLQLQRKASKHIKVRWPGE